MKRPLQNGSSGTTIEILLLLTATGASALTFLALRPVASTAPPKEEDDPDVREPSSSR